jgi:alcohol dehydrogenase (cytochrome c)
VGLARSWWRAGRVANSVTGAPLPIKDKIVFGASGGDAGARDWIAALDAATGKLLWRKYTIPAPGEPGSETWKDKTNAWQTGGGAVWVTGTYDADSNQTLWGVGNPVPMMDARARPGDNLFTNSVISWDPDNGKMNWYFWVRFKVMRLCCRIEGGLAYGGGETERRGVFGNS